MTMLDTKQLKVAFAIPFLKRKIQPSKRAVEMNNDGQFDGVKHQKNTETNDYIDLTPSHQISDVLDPAAVDLVPTESTEKPNLFRPQNPLRQTNAHLKPNPTGGPAYRSPPLTRHANRSTVTPEPQSFSSLTVADQDPSKWGPGDWDDDVFDSDSMDMSLAVMRKLVNEVSFLKSTLEDYKKFNIHLGDSISGPRHKGFLNLIASTIKKMESYIDHLRTLRDDKQRGNPNPGLVETVAGKITRRFKSRRKYLWAVMEEKVDMADDAARVEWLRKKRDVVGNVLGGVVAYLEELGQGEEWKEREVKVMAERWEKRWRAYGDMSKADLKEAGWILEVE